MRIACCVVLVAMGFGVVFSQSAEPVVLLFAGDLVLSDNVEAYVGDDTGYVFRQWKPGTMADVFMVNLEHPVTTGSERVEKKFNFKMHPKYLPTILDGGIGIVNLANNHIFDYGIEGMLDTFRTLDSIGVQYVGAGPDLTRARKPVVVEVRGKTIGFLGYFGGGEFAATKDSPGYAPRYRSHIVADVRKLRPTVDYLVVNFHWGVERAPEPEEWQVALARGVIDAGADLIVGHHPHVLQGIERYRGKAIAYSLGNFVFGGNTRHTYETGVLKVTLTEDVEVELVPVQVIRWQPRIADSRTGESILQLVQERSSSFPETLVPKQGVNP